MCVVTAPSVRASVTGPITCSLMWAAAVLFGAVASAAVVSFDATLTSCAPQTLTAFDSWQSNGTLCTGGALVGHLQLAQDAQTASCQFAVVLTWPPDAAVLSAWLAVDLTSNVTRSAVAAQIVGPLMDNGQRTWERPPFNVSVQVPWLKSGSTVGFGLHGQTVQPGGFSIAQLRIHCVRLFVSFANTTTVALTPSPTPAPTPALPTPAPAPFQLPVLFTAPPVSTTKATSSTLNTTATATAADKISAPAAVAVDVLGWWAFLAIAAGVLVLLAGLAAIVWTVRRRRARAAASESSARETYGGPPAFAGTQQIYNGPPVFAAADSTDQYDGPPVMPEFRESYADTPTHLP